MQSQMVNTWQKHHSSFWDWHKWSKRTSFWCLFCPQPFGFSYIFINKSSCLVAPNHLAQMPLVQMPICSATFLGVIFRRLHGLLPSDSSMLNSYMCRIIFVGSGCAHVSFSLTMHYPYSLMFILTDGGSFFWTICLGVGCVYGGRLLWPLLVLCQV